MADRTLAHLTINTGHSRQSPRDEVSDEVFASLVPLLGGGILPAPFDGYALRVDLVPEDDHSAVFTISRRQGDVPLATCFCYWGARSGARYWAYVGTQLDGLRAGFPRGTLPELLPERPRTVPWLAVLIWPGALLDPDAMGWLGDFERCVAWALIEKG